MKDQPPKMPAVLPLTCGMLLAGVIGFTNSGHAQNSSALPDAPVFTPVPDREGAALPFDANISGEAQPPASSMDWSYRSPATKFWEGLPLGNGRFAAMVYGRVRDEIIPFNDETLWTGQPYDAVNPNGLKSLPEIRRLTLAGRFAEATRLATNLLSQPLPFVQTHQPMGRLRGRQSPLFRRCKSRTACRWTIRDRSRNEAGYPGGTRAFRTDVGILIPFDGTTLDRDLQSAADSPKP